MKPLYAVHQWSCCVAAVIWLGTDLDANAQWNLLQLNYPIVEDFASFAAPSTWATANPAANQLDSDIWAFSQTSATGSTSSTFGLNYISGRGVSTGSTTSAGVYAFETGAAVRGIGPQASDTAWSPGNLTVKLQNATGAEIQKLRIEWSYLIYNDQPGRRYSQLLISSTDGAGSYLAPFGGEVLSQDVPQGSPSWITAPKDVKLEVSIPVSGNYYLRWSFADLAGFEGSDIHRDKIAIANLRVTAGTPGDYNHNGNVDAADYVVWRKQGGTPAEYDAWQAHFGEMEDDGLTTASTFSSVVPEPTTQPLAILGTIVISLIRRERRIAL